MKRRVISLIAMLFFIAAQSIAAQTPSAAQSPLTRAQILALLAGDVPSSRVAMLVQERGIDFASNDAFLDQIRKGGGEDDLADALRAARGANVASAPGTTPAASKGPATGGGPDEAMQEELAQRSARGAELLQSHHPAEAEAEYRAALRLDPQNSFLHVALARCLHVQQKFDEAVKEARVAVQLSPDSDVAHFCLANNLRLSNDPAGATAEYRETVRLNSKYDMAYNNLGWTLEQQGDMDGAIAQYRQALSLNPKNNFALANLGNALDHKGDLDGALAQFRELVRLRPGMAGPHFRLGQLLEKKGEPRRAVMQFRTAYDLAPDNEKFREAYERARRNQPHQ